MSLDTNNNVLQMSDRMLSQEKTTRRKFTPEFKAKLALEVLKESSAKGDLAKKYEISPEMISRWKNQHA